jgi:hypothetical protein
MSSKKLNVEGNLFSLGNENKVSESVNNVNVNVNQNVNKEEAIIKITRPELEDEKMRMTYHLKVKTIRKIKILARQADMGVSEFLQTVLDSVLDRIDIE